MTAIDAPYNFVPLSDKVVTPEWADQVSHDLPFKDGLSGEIHYTLTAHSPLLVGGNQTKATDHNPGKVEFFKTPDGKYAIPGSSLKGMIRSVLEIATFSRMGMVDDSRYSVRDLTNPARPFYGDLMTERVAGGAQNFRAKPKAGWLHFTNGDWHITPCSYSRVEHDDLASFTGDIWWQAARRVSAGDKYLHLGAGSLALRFTPGPVTLHPHSGGKQLEYSKATALGTGIADGILVFTGQPAPRNPGQTGKKHLEFIFHSSATSSFIVPAFVMRDFQHIHRKRDGYKGEEWEFWKGKPQIPVFYLTDAAGTVTSLGLALMYKLAYRHSIRQVIGHTGNGIHLNDKRLDFATLMFGRIGDEPEEMLKGRVWFETATPIENTINELPPTLVVLNAPKPTYYPNYVVQPTQGGNHLASNSYKTYMDTDSKIRGWKRYPARLQLSESTHGTDAVSTNLYPLNTGAKFSSRVVFHNLKPAELGALLWAMTWGDKPDLRHGLGMGKPLGYGQVSLNLDRHGLLANSGRPDEILGYIVKFAKYMDDKISGWAKSLQIATLCGMANPNKAGSFQGQLKHMSLEGPHGNEFKNSKVDRLALAEYPQQPFDWDPPPPPPIVWSSVPLSFNKGPKEISASLNGHKAFVAGNEAISLLDDLGYPARKLLEKGRLTATITLEHRGGKNWKIVKITP